MSGNRNKRPRLGSSSSTKYQLLHMRQDVYRIGGFLDSLENISVGTGDYYKDFEKRGSVIIDNSADLGGFEGGSLLRADSRVYLGFASSSPYSTMQISSSLSMFHDVKSQEFKPFLERFNMVKSAIQPTPTQHACIRFDFSKFNTSACGGPPETLASVESSIDSILQEAIDAFVSKYARLFSRDYPSERSSNTFMTFLDWFSSSVKDDKLKLFISVHELHQVLQRPIEASIWQGFKASALSDRLEIVHRLVLSPIWTELSRSDGVVRKFLMVGPYFVESLVRPAFPQDFPGLPEFKDLSSHVSLHGFMSSHIRTTYSLSEDRVSAHDLRTYLNLCESAGQVDGPHGKHELPYIFTKESLESVMPHVMKPDFEEVIYPKYVKKRIADALAPARRALFPILLRNAAFRVRVVAMVAEKPYWPSSIIGPVFSIDDIVNNSPAFDKAFTRIFMHCGMAKKVGPETYYRTPGPCVRKLLRSLLEETTVEKYKEPYQRRKRTQRDAKLPVDADQPAGADQVGGADQAGNASKRNQPASSTTPVADEETPALNLDSIAELKLKFTEESIAKLILDRYRVTDYRKLPSDEAQFQQDFVQLLRAALLKAGLPSSFVQHVQTEVWLRRREAPLGESHNIRCDVVVPVRFGDIDYLYIFELKYFSPGNTMEATHKGFPEALGVLESFNLRNSKFIYENRDSQTPWVKGMNHFLLELASIKNLPPHWYPDVVRSSLHMPVALSIDHIRADYTETYDIIHKRPRVKKAVAIASGTVEQVEEYRDTAALGVGDELVDADQLLPKNIEAQLGWADKRITDMGPGKTRIISFAIVNVAGALVYANQLEDKVVHRRIGVVDAYPWTADPGEPEAVKMKNMKADAARRKK